MKKQFDFKKHKITTEDIIFAVYIMTMVVFVGGLTCKVVRDYKHEYKQAIRQNEINKNKMQTVINYNQVKQK